MDAEAGYRWQGTDMEGNMEKPQWDYLFIPHT